MFRGTLASKMQKDQFGVGSLVKGGNFQSWLVVGFDNSVNLVDLYTMVMVSDEWVNVEDMNFLSTNEARELVDLTGLHWTFTDYELEPAGLKKFKK